MLLVDTFVAPSKIHGLGLFTVQAIGKGTRIWEFTPGFDLALSEEDLDRLSEACRERILNYAYFSNARLRYILCSDDARFFNHSLEPNTLSVGFDKDDGFTIAARDIAAGEELTENYGHFESPERMGRYLPPERRVLP